MWQRAHTAGAAAPSARRRPGGRPLAPVRRAPTRERRPVGSPGGDRSGRGTPSTGESPNLQSDRGTRESATAPTGARPRRGRGQGASRLGSQSQAPRHHHRPLPPGPTRRGGLVPFPRGRGTCVAQTAPWPCGARGASSAWPLLALGPGGDAPAPVLPAPAPAAAPATGPPSRALAAPAWPLAPPACCGGGGPALTRKGE